MKIKRVVTTILLTLIFPLHLCSDGITYEQIMYQMHKNGLQDALRFYADYYEERASHDYALLQNLMQRYLESAAKEPNIEKQILLSFCIALTQNVRFLPILSQYLHDKNPSLQISAVLALSNILDSGAYELLLTALSSSYAIVQLEALYTLSRWQHPLALSHITTIMEKFPEGLQPIFPALIASIDSPEASKELYKLLNHHNEFIRLETLIQIRERRRDDFIEAVRTLALQTYNRQQEAAITTLASFKDASSTAYFNEKTSTGGDCIAMAAEKALISLDPTKKPLHLMDLAKKNNLFAINALQGIKSGNPILENQLTDSDRIVRYNAAFTLLYNQDPLCRDTILEMFYVLTPLETYYFQPSPGKSFCALKIASCTQKEYKKRPYLQQTSQKICEDILQKAASLPLEDFLYIADTLLTKGHPFLIPSLIKLLENQASKKSIELLKQYQQKLGDEFIRMSCALALYRLDEPGPWLDALLVWVRSQHHITDWVKLKPQKTTIIEHAFQSQLDYTPQLFMEIYQSLAQKQDQRGIALLLDGIVHASEESSLILAALLMRATE